MVSKGETAWDIAQFYNVSLQNFLEINNLSENARIHPGDKLEIPSVSVHPASLPEGVPQSKNVDMDFDYYIVRSGDNLNGISKKLDVPVSQLKSLNKIRNSNRIKVGQQLKFRSIPLSKSNSVASVETEPENMSLKSRTYIVGKGDTLWDIAQANNTSIAEIKKINGMGKSNKIKPGQELIIPPG